MLGSHNSFSCLPPKNLWGKITKLWGKCQSLNLQDQYDKGVRCFDIRLRRIENTWHIVHNRIDYGSCNELNLISKLKSLCNNHDAVYFRFLLDERKIPKYARGYINLYLGYIQYIINLIPDIKIAECRVFWNWRTYFLGSATCPPDNRGISCQCKCKMVSVHPWNKVVCQET